MTTIDVGAIYAAGQRRIAELARNVGEDDARIVVPCCPRWTVHDLVAHLSGVVADAIVGTMAGAPGDAWTEAQVTPRRAWPLKDVLDEWDRNVGAFAAQLTAAADQAPTSVIMDITTHEQDLRGALGLSRMTDRVVIDWGTPRLVKGLGRRLDAAGLPAITVGLDGEELTAGSAAVAGSALRLDVSAFELFRAGLGRRSMAQLAALGWSGGDPTAVLDHLSVFPPAAYDIIE